MFLASLVNTNNTPQCCPVLFAQLAFIPFRNKDPYNCDARSKKRGDINAHVDFLGSLFFAQWPYATRINRRRKREDYVYKKRVPAYFEKIRHYLRRENKLSCYNDNCISLDTGLYIFISHQFTNTIWRNISQIYDNINNMI